ncbi:MAG: adenosine kinase [Bacteroidales bacterium]|nr:adenosine kinase [Bacteroidales bacterium]
MAKVLGMGNALVDIMIKIEDESVFGEFQLEKGGMRLVDAKTVETVLSKLKHLPAEKAPGGSAANTINGVSNLGMETGFIGKVASDANGNFMEHDMLKNHIQPLLLKGNSPTGVAVAMVTPDSERTFAVNLGCAIELSPDDIQPEMFDGYDYFHIEGYLVQNHDLLRKAVKLAKDKNVKVSLDLASFDVVRENLGFLNEIIHDYVDIVFANEDEAKAYTGLNPEEALHKIYEDSDVAVVKTGKKGSLIKHNNQVHQIGVIEAISIDTTGAGDLYAGGFLFGLATGLPLEKCGKIGSLLAGKVIEVLGAKMDKETWEFINKEVKRIIEE